MRALDRKLVRDLLHLKSQVLAIALVVACGMATYVTLNSAYRALVTSQASITVITALPTCLLKSSRPLNL